MQYHIHIKLAEILFLRTSISLASGRVRLPTLAHEPAHVRARHAAHTHEEGSASSRARLPMLERVKQRTLMGKAARFHGMSFIAHQPVRHLGDF